MTLTLLDPAPVSHKDIAAGLVAAFPGTRRRLVHTQESAEYLLVELDGEAAVVAPLLDLDELEGTTVLVVCGPPAPLKAAALTAWLRAHPEVWVVDCSRPGIAPDEMTCLATGSLPPGTSARWFCPPDPALAGPLRVLDALAPLGLETIHLTVMSPASSLGDEAVAELAAQAVARLSGAVPSKPRVLPRILAFDLAPSTPTSVGRIVQQLAHLLPGVDSHVNALDVGVFFGHAATLAVHCRHLTTEKAVRAMLRAKAGVHLARRGERLAPSDLVDHDHVACSELHLARGWVTAWLAWDGSRVGGEEHVVDLIRSIMAAAATEQ